MHNVKLQVNTEEEVARYSNWQWTNEFPHKDAYGPYQIICFVHCLFLIITFWMIIVCLPLYSD